MKHLIKITLVLSLFVVLNFSSCNNDEEGPPVDILTLTADRLYYPGDGVTEWVIIWNSDGEILDYQPFTSGSTQTFTTTGNVIDNKITVGFVSHIVTDGHVDAMINVYGDVAAGKVVNRVVDDGLPDIVSGTLDFTVNVDSSDPFDYLLISNKYGTVSLGATGQTSLSCFLDTRSTKYLVTMRRGDEVSHKVLENVSEGEIIDLTDEDFTSFEHQITINLPEPMRPIFFFFNGYESDIPLSGGGYYLDNYFGSSSQESVTTGYIDGLSKYATHLLIHASGDKNALQYQKTGSLPGSINWPNKNQFGLPTVDPFSFEVTGGNATMVKATWQSSTQQYGVRWVVRSPNAAIKVGPLPDELLKDRSYLTPVTADFESAEVHIGPATYDEHLKREFDLLRTDPFESISVIVRK